MSKKFLLIVSILFIFIASGCSKSLLPWDRDGSLEFVEEDFGEEDIGPYEKPGPSPDFGTAEQGMPGDGSTGSFIAEPYLAEPALPEKEEVRDRLLPHRSTHLLEDINFAFDRYDLDDRSRAILKNNMAYMKFHPNLKIEIQGHCDERGTNRYNISLGERRAQSTKSYLISLGVEETQIRTISYGEEKPFCFESNEICWYQNRRAHFLIAVPHQSHVDKRH